MMELNNLEIDILSILRKRGRALTAKHIRVVMHQCGWESLDNDRYLATLQYLCHTNHIQFESPIDSYRISDKGTEAIDEYMKNFGYPFAALVQRFCARVDGDSVTTA